VNEIPVLTLLCYALLHFIGKTASKRKHKQAGIFVQRGQNFKHRFLEIVCMAD